MCSETEDSFLRPPLWEDITSSIQNIDPENAIMLNTLTGATQVKMEANDDGFLEPLSSPLLSPLDIKSEKAHHHALHHNNNHISHLHNNNNNNNYAAATNYHQHPLSQHPSHHNGYAGTNGSGGIQLHHHAHLQQNNNYYGSGSVPGGSWHSQPPHQQPSGQVQNYPPKFSPQSAGAGSGLGPPLSMSRLMYVPPLTPPNSDPGSPINGLHHQGGRHRTPPPPYPPPHHGQQAPPPSQHHHITCTPIHIHINTGSLGTPGGGNHGAGAMTQSSAHNGGINGSSTGGHGHLNGGHSLMLSSATVVKAVQRYNRRNNPELEKRRIHHCDFMGEYFFYFFYPPLEVRGINFSLITFTVYLISP